MKDKTKVQTKPTVDREAVRMLAIELGAREAARRLGIKESTVLSWAKRCDWKLPKRKGGATLKNATAITLRSKPGDALIAVHADLEEATKTGLKQTLAKAVQALAKKEALPVESIAQFKDACLAGAKLFGWDGKPETSINVGVGVGVGVVCDEATRMRLIEMRQKLLAGKPDNLAPKGVESRNVATKKIEPKCNDATPDGKPVSLWSVPAGTKATSNDSPAFRAWLEHEKAEPEPGSEYEI